jgi:hypothetical protein
MQVAKALIAAGAEVDLPDKSTAMTPLHYGAMGGHLDIIDSLIGAKRVLSVKFADVHTVVCSVLNCCVGGWCTVHYYSAACSSDTFSQHIHAAQMGRLDVMMTHAADTCESTQQHVVF